MTAVLLPLFGPAAPAGAAAEQFTLNMTSGQLVLRDAEPFEILLPTTISGTNTDGQLSDVTFATPTISFVQDVPQYQTQAFIDAAFSMVGPGSGTINEDGDVTVQVGITVDLHLVVPLLAFPSDCRATPINLTLVSTAPYDGESVTLSAPNFTVPPVPETDSCSSLVAPAVNNALAGAGHALTMTLAGDVTLPVAGEPTVTTLALTPDDGARVGQEVTLSAAVAPEDEPEEPVELTGSVTFYDGATNLGTVALDEDGKASLTTTALPAGTRQVRAVYSGAPPDWRPSSSPVTPYVVAAVPLISTDLAGGVIIGGDAKEFTVSVRNTGLGVTLDNARVDVRIFRTSTVPSILPVTLHHVVDGTPVPVALTLVVGNEYRGSIESDAWLVPPGQEVTETFLLAAPTGTAPGPVRVEVALVTVEDDATVPLSTATGDIVITAEARYQVSFTAGAAGNPGRPPSLPPIPATPPVTPVVRQGTTAEIYNLQLTPVQGSVNPTGTVRFSIGGRPVVGRGPADPSLAPWADAVPLQRSGGGSFHVAVPGDMAVGDHVLQVRYSGDDLYAATVTTWPIRVEPGRGDVYDCVYSGLATGRFVANVEIQAQIAGVGARGDDLPVTRVEARMYLARTRGHNVLSTSLNLPALTVDFELTGGGTGAFADSSQTGNSGMAVDGSPPIDWIITLTEGAGSLPVGHDAGTALDVELESLVFDAHDPNITFQVSCRPLDIGVQVATVTATGTSLTVNPTETVRQGDEVELTAQALPASPGVVEFLDGETTVGVAPVDSQGVARVTVDDLSPGTRFLTARYFGTVFPDSTSDPVEFTVEAIDCIDFAETGSAAVVRLIYLTVLARCPDQAGFEFWVGRLDGGTTREAVARSIAASHEARKVLVDEAYELMLERTADTAGREHWATRLGRTGSYRDLIGHLGSSPEFRTLAGGTDAGVVARLYDRLLHRTPSADDTAYWVGQIQARGVRATVIRMFDLDEPLRTLVGDTYRTIVDRAPTTVERDAGVALMRSSSDRSALNASVINSNDFYTRAQTFPNPT